MKLPPEPQRLIGDVYARVRARHLRSTLAHVAPFPRRIAIEPASACNLACPMCPTPNKGRKNGIMTMATFRRIIDEVAPHGLERLFFHLWGEPLIHPHVGEMIAYAKAVPSIRQTVMSTNATLLHGARAEAILQSGLDYLVLSLDGASQATYERLRLGARYDATMDNVAGFLRKRGEIGRGPRVVFQIIEMKQTQLEIETFRARWTPLLEPGDEISVKPFNNWSSHDGSLAQPGIGFRSPCTAFLWEFLAVTWDGKALPCCFDCEGAMALGQVPQQSLQEIWQGPALRKLREDHHALDFSNQPLCAGCDNTKEVLDVSRLVRMLGHRAHRQPFGD